MREYTTPVDLIDANMRLLVLEDEIKIIADQMDDPGRRHIFKDARSYHEWRASAKQVQTGKQAESKYLEMWIKQNKQTSLKTLLAASVPILRRAGEAGLLSSDELAYVNQVGKLVTGSIIITGGFNAEA